MATTTRQRLHGSSKAIDRQVMDLYREGWHIPNIVSIAHLDIETVKGVLERNNVILDSILK